MMWTSGFQVGLGFVLTLTGLAAGAGLTIGIGVFLLVSGTVNGIISRHN